MYRLLSALRKEFLILIRDIPGLAILFIMPVLLIIIVTLAQQNALKSSKESKTDIIFVDQSHSLFSKLLLQNLDSSRLYRIVTNINNVPVGEILAKEKIGKGDYPVGIIIKNNDTTIQLLLDPTLQISFKNSLTGSLSYFIKGTQSQLVIEQLLMSLSPAMANGMDDLIKKNMKKMPQVSEVYATQENASIKPTIIQNNIPGFILFAMFFIVIPLGGSMVTEKMEGAFDRLRTLPVSIPTLLFSKVVLFLGVCLIQFVLMIMVGTLIMPLFFGTQALQLGSHYTIILLATICAALAATGFGLLVGSFSSSQGQAALFGSVMVVILGVISGTFLPVYLMPHSLQNISLLSPIRWGIDNYLIIFIREGRFSSIFPNIFRLLLFFVFAVIISILTFARRR